MDLDQALQTYIAESETLLKSMEEGLLGLEAGRVDADLVDGLFRAVHTIKGSAGLFGLDAIVSFTHLAESVLEQLRAGAIRASPELVQTLLGCCDHIGSLVDAMARRGAEPDADQARRGELLLQSLGGFLQPAHEGEAADSPPEVPGPTPPAACFDRWDVSVCFGREVLRNGMDPSAFIRYLSSICEIAALRTFVLDMPSLSEMDPEACYLGFDIEVAGIEDKKALEDVFEFVRDDCLLSIRPAQAHAVQAGGPDSAPGLPPHDGPGFRQAGERSNPAAGRAGAQPGPRQAPAGERIRSETGLEIGHAMGQESGQANAGANGHEPPSRARAGGVARKAPLSQFVRVNADKLDQLIVRVGELVIAGASAVSLAQRDGSQELQEAAAIITRFIEEIREDAQQLRMVEIGETFSRFHRVVRDVSQELGKDVALEITGADTELDKTVVERIGEPLTHLVRNALDHGLETTQARLAAGKPARGRLRLNAYHSAGSIVIEVCDDGAGLDARKIMHRAVERGLVPAEAELSEREVFDLVFEPGFSTADKVSNLSGRGVGMDVVKRDIQALRGTVEIDSHAGRGTTVRIRLPLTLAIIDGFLVGLARARYVVPLDMVLECIEMPAQGPAGSEEGLYINLRGEVLPCVRLRDQFGITGEAARRENVVVVQFGERKAGLVVDELLGEFQAVIKPLSKIFGGLRGVSGSTILGSGSVALVLDVPALVERAIRREYETFSPAR